MNKVIRYNVGNKYERETIGSVHTDKIYVGGDAYSAPIVCMKTGTGNWDIYYICRDHLGSITHLIARSSNIIQELSYDAWGRRRDPATHLVYTPGSEPSEPKLARGYTSHEHLQTFGLINMNARLYDPLVGRFLSPDPYVQAPNMSQNFNRYSYCLNNPLRYTDPSGEWFLIDDLIVGAVGFVVGYVGHGLSTGNWGWNAVGTGASTGLMSWLSYNTAGGAAAMSGIKYAGYSTVNTAISYFTPSINFSAGDFNMSISPTAMFTGGVAAGSGFSLGLSIMASYDIGDFRLSAGGGLSTGGGYLAGGTSYSDGKFGVSWHKTGYYGTFKQSTATVGVRYGDWSIQHENDLGAMLGDGGDRFRTAAIEIGYKNFVIGANVFTNDGRMFKNSDNEPELNEFFASNTWGSNKVGSYRYGHVYQSPFYIGLRNKNGFMRIGINAPLVQDMTQNFIHKLGNYPYFDAGVGSSRFFIQAGRYNPFSLYGL